jgi:hypothetical protein
MFKMKTSNKKIASSTVELSGLASSVYNQIKYAGTEPYLSALVDAAAVSALASDRAGLDREARAWIKFANATRALGRELLDAAIAARPVDPGPAPTPTVEDRVILPPAFADTVRNHIVVERTSGTISNDGRRTFVRKLVEFIVVDKRLPREAQGRDDAPRFKKYADADRSALLSDMFPDRFKTAAGPKDSADLKPEEA